MLRPIPFLSGLFLMASALCLHADLNEEHFSSYSIGDLLKQGDWFVEAPQDGTYAPVQDRISVLKNSDFGSGNILVWKAGFPREALARAVKQFPVTTSPRVEVNFDLFLEGELEGTLNFNQSGGGSVRLFFVRGKINILSNGETGTSTIPYLKKEWMNIRLNFDFTQHVAELRIEGEPAGSFPISPDMQTLSQVNFFGGGPDFETRLGNLVIRSLE